MDEGNQDPRTAPLLGHMVADRYFVEKHLGEGGMGAVYRARHVTLDKQVALKVLHGEFSRKEELVERFLQEAKSASRIRNAHVIDITDFGITSEGFVFFAMEYLEGRDLHTLLKEAADSGALLPWERARGIFLQVCEALEAAHAAGIIHRDLKPENIFLVEGAGQLDYVKLLDFGIAKVESTGAEGERKLTKTGMLFGTPEYMAPEQAKGEKPDLRVDVYAMGCLLFQLLVGAVPFRADSFMAILTQHMVEPVPEIGPELLGRSGAPTGILPVVYKALEKDRDKRYPDIRALAEAVRGAESARAPAQGVGAAESSTTARRKRPTTQNAPDWTGSVRQIEELVEAEEAELSAEETDGTRPGGRRWLLAGAAVLVLAGGGGGVLLTTTGGEQGSPTPAEGTAPASAPEAALEAERAEAKDSGEAVPANAPSDDTAGPVEAAASTEPGTVRSAPPVRALPERLGGRNGSKPAQHADDSDEGDSDPELSGSPVPDPAGSEADPESRTAGIKDEPATPNPGESGDKPELPDEEPDEEPDEDLGEPSIIRPPGL